MKQAETGGNGMGRKNHRFRGSDRHHPPESRGYGNQGFYEYGAAMAPAAWNTICQNFEDFGVGAPITTASSPEIWEQ